MSWPRSREELINKVVLLSQEGMSRRAIARTLGLGRNTVRETLEQHGQKRQTPHIALEEKPERAPRPSKLDPYRDDVQHLLESFPEITAQRVFEEIRNQGFPGGYTAVKKLVRKLRPKPTPRISLPTPVYGPGKMAECDWSAYRVEFTHAPSKLLQAFGYALCFSRRKYFRFYPRSDLYSLMEGHVQVFAAFQGVAETVKYDSQKAVVLRWEGRQPIYNLRFIDFATYYEFKPLACRPAHPNDKPIVERSFWELERSFFNGRKFRDEQDLEAQLIHWMTTISDQRRNPKTKCTPFEGFAEEKSFLRPLPLHSYDTARVAYRLCNVSGFVSWEGNSYSLPYDYVTDILPVRVTQTELFVYAPDLSLIARHELASKGAGVERCLPGHHPRLGGGRAELDQLRQTYQEFGPQASSFLSGLESIKPRSAAYHARRILTLREHYATHDLLAALAHAHSFGAFEHGAVERILLARAMPRRLDEYVVRATSHKLQSVLGQSSTEPRDLTEYDALPCWSRPQGAQRCPLVDETTTKECPPDEPETNAHERADGTETNPHASNDSRTTSNSSD